MIDQHDILITGGAGFIGSELVRRLVANNRVTVFDTFQRDALRGTPVADHPNLHMAVGDVRDFAALREAVNNHDVIVHCAGVAGTNSVGKSPITTLTVNLIGTANVLQAGSDISRIVVFSTSEVYGTHADHLDESAPSVVGPPGEPRWTYAAGKLAAEHLALAYHAERGSPVTVVRPFNVYGPGQVGEGAIHVFCRNALLNETIGINGDGSQIRAWTYLEDLVDGVLLTLDNPAAIGKVFNLGNDSTAISTSELAKLVVELADSNSGIEHRPSPPAEVQLRIPDISLARRVLGFDPQVGLAEGIARTLDWLRPVLGVA